MNQQQSMMKWFFGAWWPSDDDDEVVLHQPARNLPEGTHYTDERVQAGADLETILAAKANLRPTNTNPRRSSFQPRHPVLCELLKSTPIISP